MTTKKRFKHTKHKYCLIHILHLIQNGKCFYCDNDIELDFEARKLLSTLKEIRICGKKIRRNRSFRKRMSRCPTLDHFIPLNKEGLDGMANLVLVHNRCNLIKSNKLPTNESLIKFKDLRKKFNETWTPISYQKISETECKINPIIIYET